MRPWAPGLEGTKGLSIPSWRGRDTVPHVLCADSRGACRINALWSKEAHSLQISPEQLFFEMLPYSGCHGMEYSCLIGWDVRLLPLFSFPHPPCENLHCKLP